MQIPTIHQPAEPTRIGNTNISSHFEGIGNPKALGVQKFLRDETTKASKQTHTISVSRPGGEGSPVQCCIWLQLNCRNLPPSKAGPAAVVLVWEGSGVQLRGTAGRGSPWMKQSNGCTPYPRTQDFRVSATAGIGVEHVGHYPKGLSFVDWVGRILTQQQWHHWSHTMYRNATLSVYTWGFHKYWMGKGCS